MIKSDLHWEKGHIPFPPGEGAAADGNREWKGAREREAEQASQTVHTSQEREQGLKPSK